jgi:predicted MFS family arabinose efflux permease
LRTNATALGRLRDDIHDDVSLATLLGVSFVIHQIGSVVGAWGGGMIFDMFGNYDLAWRFGVSLGIVAGIVQILFGGPSGTRSGVRPVPAAG